MYFFFAVLGIPICIARYYMLADKGILLHTTIYVVSVLGFFALWEIVLLSGRLLEKRLPLSTNPLRRMFIQTAILYGIIISPILFIYNDQIVLATRVPPQLIKAIGFVVYFLLSVAFNLMYLGVIYFYNWRQDVLNLASMQRQQATVQYDNLRNQLNPHFLFNALASLNSLIFENQQLASDFLQQLAQVYRYTLQSRGKETVSVKTELGFIAHYISLLQTRFPHDLQFNMRINDDTTDKGIVPVTSQMLIENVIKHNVISSEHPLTISITTTEDYFIIENEVNKKDQIETSNKQGLDNLKSLYNYLTDKPVEIIEVNNVFTVKIPLV
jgi:hypothetical protein